MAAIFFSQIDQNGLNFTENLTQNSYDGISRSYTFSKVLDANGKVHRIENTSVNLYEIKDYERIKVK
ncbi:MAG: hypothetical protein LRY27_02010 [Chitinophagales bacterium]|nr:hypothetical protein [Chitinophagales bacterium]